MTKVISIVNNKGGVGKTASTGIMGELLAFTGKRVLCIDLDQQSNLSMLFNVKVEDSEEVISGIENPEEENIAELFKFRYKTKEDVTKLIKKTKVKNLDVLPSSARHKHTQLNISKNETGNNNIILKKALATIKEDYDYILIDNAPASDILTVNSMFASDYVLVPVRAEALSGKGLKETISNIKYIKEEHDLDKIEFLGTFLTQVEINTNVYKDLKEYYQNDLGNKFFRTPIRKDIKVSEIQTVFKPVLEYCPDANVVYDYAMLLLELGIMENEEKQILQNAINE